MSYILVNDLVHLLEHLSFRLRCSSFLLSKFAAQLKLIQSVVRVGILGVCVTSSIFRILLSGFWVSKSQISGTQFQGPWCQGPMPQYQSPRCQGSVSQGPRVTGSQVPESQVSKSQVSGSRLSGFQVSGSWGPGLRS